jgi:transposase
MSTNNQRSASQESKERFWRRVMRQWRGSSLSVRAFCEEQGLSEPSFYAWRRTLVERDAAAVGFVPVQVAPEPKATTKADGLAGAVELVLGAGRRLRVGPGFDGPTLTRLLVLLEEGRP